MNDNAELELESQIHSLLENRLGGPQRDALLARITADKSVRRKMAEMLRCRELSRRAFGYDSAEPKMHASMERLLRDLPAGQRSRRRIRWGAILWPAAAVLAIAVSVYLAVQSHMNTRTIKNQLALVQQKVDAWQKSAGQDASYYLRMWNEVSPPGEANRPWMLVTNKAGRFEYAAGAPAAAEASARAVVLRCLVVSADGKVLKKINLLLPANRPSVLDIGEAGQLAGLPVRCNVTSSGEWLGMDLAVGKDAAKSVGVAGLVRTDGSITPIGEFRLGKQNLKVYLQAVKLNGTVG